MKIGLVLPAPPAYSETFFRSKIAGLLANGATVIVYVNSTTTNPETLCPVKNQLPVGRMPFLNIILVGFTLCKAMIKYPKVLKQFVKLERMDGKSWQRVIESIYINHHILSTKKLDWLHFGFATMAIGRENVAKVLRAQMAVSFRGYDVSIYPLKHAGCYERLWEKVNKIHTISDDLLTIAYQKLNLPKKIPIQKITPAIDIKNFKISEYYDSKYLCIPIKFLTVARLHWKKGLEYTLEALALLHQKNIDFHYQIIGDGVDYERLVFAAHQLGIRDKVEFVGKVPHEQVKDYYKDADIYLQYSVQEGFCNAVLEAQAVGLLCVVSDAEGLPENVLHGQTGWVVPRRQPLLLAKQIESILQVESSYLHQIKKNAVQRVQLEYNLEKQQRAFAHFYNLTVGSSSSKAAPSLSHHP